jgi:hypothetical protein
VRALAPFADCSAFLDHVKAAARERVGPYGLEATGGWWGPDVIMEEMAEDAAGGRPAPLTAEEPASGPAAAPSPSGDGSFTGTNVQEAGVDEPDIVKTDGDRILVVSENVLTYVDIAAGTPVETDDLVLPEGWNHELFFAGDRALVLTNGGSWGVPVGPPVGPLVDTGDDRAAEPTIGPDHGGPAALVTEIDLSDPSDLRIAASMRIEGQYLSARAIGDHVRLAVSSGPSRLPWVYPQSVAGEQRATETNRAIVDESRLEDWVPSYVMSSDDASTGGSLLGCDRLHHPVDFSGFDVISVVDLDLADGLATGFRPADAVGVLAAGQTVYSSNDRFYVATTKWTGADLPRDGDAIVEWSDDVETDLHAFAIAPGAPTRYVASGTVEGSLLDQFSLDEHDGYLRVITTDGSPWDEHDLSESSLVVLQEQGERLVEVGRVGGLGRGERLYSARLMDDVGFAVTFRQVDPFYVLDLRDPTLPKVTGELKIPGFSTYLHPVGPGRVLGIGQDATEEGGTTGLKLSLFDVSDPTAPRELSVWTMPNANSEVEWDHRAFQMWGSTAIVPVQSWDTGFTGAILFELGDSISEVGRVTHVGGGDPASDCRPLTVDDLEEGSELSWIALDGRAHLQVCGPEQAGGWGSWPCEQLAASDLAAWGDAALAVPEGGRLEVCWPAEQYEEPIRRSLVADDVLYTMTARALQANALDGLPVLATLPLR